MGKSSTVWSESDLTNLVTGKQNAKSEKERREFFERNPHLGKAPAHRATDKGVPAELNAKLKPAKGMNKTEAGFLEILKRVYPGKSIMYEAYTLRLGGKVRYRPDFAIHGADNTGVIYFFEVKGAFIFSRSLGKPRMAATMYPHRFFLAQKKDGVWNTTEIVKEPVNV